MLTTTPTTLPLPLLSLLLALSLPSSITPALLFAADPLTFLECVDFCESSSSLPACISSEADGEAVFAEIKDHFYGSPTRGGFVYSGLVDVPIIEGERSIEGNNEHGFTHVSSSCLSPKFAWAKSEPDNYLGVSERCAAFDSGGRLYDVPCDCPASRYFCACSDPSTLSPSAAFVNSFAAARPSLEGGTCDYAGIWRAFLVLAALWTVLAVIACSCCRVVHRGRRGAGGGRSVEGVEHPCCLPGEPAAAAASSRQTIKNFNGFFCFLFAMLFLQSVLSFHLIGMLMNGFIATLCGSAYSKLRNAPRIFAVHDDRGVEMREMGTMGAPVQATLAALPQRASAGTEDRQPPLADSTAARMMMMPQALPLQFATAAPAAPFGSGSEYAKATFAAAPGGEGGGAGGGTSGGGTAGGGAFCAQCGTAKKAAAMFCSNCGRKH